MTETESDDGRAAAKQWTVDIGQRVQVERKRQELTAQDLADKTARLGYAISRATVTAIENGRKELFSVQELTVLARALQIAPVALLYPVHANTSTRVPGDPPADVPAIHAARWFSGEYRFAAEVTEANLDDYKHESKISNTSVFDYADMPVNDAGPLADVRHLDRQCDVGLELCAVIMNLQDRLQVTQTPSIRDAMRTELEILFTHVARILKHTERSQTSLEAIGSGSVLRDSLVERHQQLAEKQQRLDSAWSGGDGHG
jgi:transcriptional regulator with XRE-family HTH domain